MGYNNVVKTTVLLKDINDFVKVNDIYKTFFTSHYPARAAYQVSMVENRKKQRQNSYPIIHCPTSEGVSEVSERASAAEGASEASSPEQANE